MSHQISDGLPHTRVRGRQIDQPSEAACGTRGDVGERDSRQGVPDQYHVSQVANFHFADHIIDVVSETDFVEGLRVAARAVTGQVDSDDSFDMRARQEEGRKPAPTPCSMRTTVDQDKVRHSSPPIY